MNPLTNPDINSYNKFISDNFRTREELAGYINSIRENDPRFRDMSFKQAAQTIQSVTGNPAFKQFTNFTGPEQTLMDFGRIMTLGSQQATPADTLSLLTGGTMDFATQGQNDFLNNTWALSSQGTGEKIATALGASPETAKLVGQGASEAPAIAGLVGLGMLPGGMALSSAAMYGQGLQGAAEQGLEGAQARAVGAVGPAISYATMKMARPMQNAAADVVGKLVAKVTSGAESKAIADAMAKGGELGMREVMGNKDINPLVRYASRVAQESLIQTGVSALGVAGEVASAAIADPEKFFTEDIYKKDFWVPVLVSEFVEAAGDTFVGRVHAPIKTQIKEAEQRVAETKGRQDNQDILDKAKQDANKQQDLPLLLGEDTKGLWGKEFSWTKPEDVVNDLPDAAGISGDLFAAFQSGGMDGVRAKANELQKTYADALRFNPVDDANHTNMAVIRKVQQGLDAAAKAEKVVEDPNGIIDPKVKQENGIDPNDPESDSKVVEKQKTNQVAKAKLIDDTHKTAQEEGKAPLLEPNDKTTIDTVVTSLLSGNHVDTPGDAIRAVKALFTDAVASRANGTSVFDAIKGVLVKLSARGGRNRDFRIKSGHEGVGAEDYVAFRNPETKDHGIMVHIVRANEQGKLSPVNLTHSADVPGSKNVMVPPEFFHFMGDNSKAELDQILFGGTGNLTPQEWDIFRAIGKNFQQQYAALDTGVSFDPGIKGRGNSKEYQQKMLQFFEVSGIQAALKRANVKLRIGSATTNNTREQFISQPLDFISSNNRAALTSHKPLPDGTRLWYISRHNSNDKFFDPHELGHVVHKLIEEGQFGEQAKQDLNKFLTLAQARSNGETKDSAAFVDELRQNFKTITGDKSFNPAQSEDLRNYWNKNVDEIFAQTFLGWFGQENVVNKQIKNWHDFFKTNFKSLYETLGRIFSALRGNKTPEQQKSALNQFSPEFHTGQQLLEGIFTEALRPDSREVSVQKNRTLKKYSDNIKQLYLQLEARAKQPVHALNTFKEIAKQAKDMESVLRKNKDPEGEIKIQIDEFIEERLRGVLDGITQNPDILGATSLETGMSKLPWVQMLANAPTNISKVFDFLKSKTDLKLVDVFAKFMDQSEWVDGDVKANGDFLSGRASMILYSSYLGRAVSEMVGKISGEMKRPEPLECTARQLIKLNEVLRLWYEGRLPGQDGRAMYEENMESNLRDMISNLYTTGGQTKKEDNIAHMQKFHKWFPILAKGFYTALTTRESGQKTYVDVNGNINFEKAGKKTARKKFESAEMAQAWIDEQPKSDFYFLRVMSQTDAKGVEHHTVRATQILQHGGMGGFLQLFDNTTTQREIDDLIDTAEAELTLQDEGMNPDVPKFLNPKNVFGSPSVDEQVALHREKQVIAELKKTKGKSLLHEMRDVLRANLKQIIGDRMLPTEMVKAEKALDVAFARDAKEQNNFAKVILEIGRIWNVDADTSFEKLRHQTLIPILCEMVNPKYSEEVRNKRKNQMMLVLDSKASFATKNYIKSYFEYSRNLMGAVAREQYNAITQGAMPILDPKEYNAVDRVGDLNLYTTPVVMQNLAYVQGAMPGGFTKRADQLQKATALVPTKLFKGIQQAHNTLGAGAVQIALQDPDFHQLGTSLHGEERNTTARTTMIKENLFCGGELLAEQDARGLRWIKSKQPRLDNQSAFYKIKSDPHLDQLYNEIKWLENLGNGKFAELFAHEDQAIVDEAKRLTQKMRNAEDGKIITEALERSYAAQWERVSYKAAADNKNHALTFAYILSLRGYFNNNVEHAQAFAEQFQNTPSDQRVAALVNALNLTDQDLQVAQDLVAAYEKTETALGNLHMKLRKNLYYTDERRMKPYHVYVVFKKGTKSKTNVLRKEDTKFPLTGYYDFNSPQEAYDFIAKMKAEGHQVPNNPTDFNAKRFKYQPISGTIDDAIKETVDKRSSMVSMLLAGQVEDSVISDVMKLIEPISAEVIEHNDAVLATKADNMKKKFVEGRENLDMLDQFEKSTQRLMASISRKQTDTLFKLWARDKRMIEKSDRFQVFETAKDAMRMQDSEAQKKIAQAGYTMYLLGSVSSAMLEIIQYPVVLSTMMIEKGASVSDALGIPLKVFKQAQKSSFERIVRNSDKPIWEGEEYELIRFAETSGALNQRRNLDLSQQSDVEKHNALMGQGGIAMGKNLFGLTYRTLDKMYGYMNRINAEMSLVSTYQMLRKKNFGDRKTLSKPEQTKLFEESLLWAEIANGSLGRIGRPNLFFASRSQATRNFGSMYWGLQSFVNAQLTNLLRMTQKSFFDTEGQFTKEEKAQARKALGYFTAVTIAGTGVMGLPLAPSIAKAIQMVFGDDWDPEDKLREMLYDPTGQSPEDRAFMGDIVATGLIGTYSELDLNSRLNIAGYGPLSGYEGFDPQQIGGPLVGLAATALKDIPKYRNGDISLAELGTNLLPNALRKGIRMEFFNDGNIAYGNKNYMYTPDTIEKLGVWAGFNTKTQRKQMKYVAETSEALQAETAFRKRLANDIAEAPTPYMKQLLLQQGARRLASDPTNPEIMQETTKSLASNVAERLFAKQYGTNIREGSGVDAQLKKQLYMPAVPQPSYMQKLMFEQQTMQDLGMQARFNPRAMRLAQRKDRLQELYPELTSGGLSALSSMRPTDQPAAVGLQTLLRGLD